MVLFGLEVPGAAAKASSAYGSITSVNGLARAIVVPANHITVDMAARLGRYFGALAKYWLNIQRRFDFDSIDWAAIERDVLPKQAA
jgi:plasmid maintenance system antidote protein VapI